MNWKNIIAGAVSGFVSAVIIDLNAWAKSGGKPFDWKIAFVRWVQGAIAGALTGAGVPQ